MEIRTELTPYANDAPRTALTIGAYDGVHVGHRQVIAEVARHYSLTPQDLTGGKRDRRTTAARHLAMYLLRTDLRCRPEAIGQALGGRDRHPVVPFLPLLLVRAS